MEGEKERKRECTCAREEMKGDGGQPGGGTRLGWRGEEGVAGGHGGVAGRRTKETRKEKPKGDDRQVERRRKFISKEMWDDVLE